MRLCERRGKREKLTFMFMPKLGYAENKISIEIFRCIPNSLVGMYQRVISHDHVYEINIGYEWACRHVLSWRSLLYTFSAQINMQEYKLIDEFYRPNSIVRMHIGWTIALLPIAFFFFLLIFLLFSIVKLFKKKHGHILPVFVWH